MKLIPCKSYSTSLRHPMLAVLLLLALPSAVFAQVALTWSADGSGGSGTWDAGITPDWYNGSPTVWPATSSGGDTATFAGTAGTVNVDPGGVAATTLYFTAGGYNIGGSGVLTLDGSLSVPTIDVGAGLTNTINATLAGTNGFSKVDSGKLILGGSNTFSGNISFGNGTGGGPSEGVIQITQAAALGVLGNNVNNGVTNQLVVIRDNGDLLELNGASGNITLPSYLGFVTSGPNGVIRNVAGSNSITGNILLSTGVSDTGILSDGGSLTLAGGINPGSTARNLILMGTNTAVNVVSGVISNASNGALLGLIKKSANSWNTWMLTGSNTYGGQTVVGVNTGSAPYVTNGILRLANSSAIGTSNLVVYGGYEAGRVEFTGNITITNPISLYGRQGFTYPGLSSFSGTNVLSGPINVTANGSRVTFESQAGLLTVSGSDMTGNNGRVLTLVGNGNGVFAKNVTPVVVSSLNKYGNGVWTLNGTNSYTGATSVSAGQLQLAKEMSLYSNTPASWTAANISVSSGATLAFNVGGAGEFTSSDISTLATLGGPANGFQSGSILGLDTSDAISDFVFGSNLVNPNSTNVLGLSKLGANRLVLSGNNSYSGGTTINGGTLVAASTSAFGAAGRIVTINDGASVDFATDTSANAYVLNVNSGATVTVLVNRATTGAAITQAMSNPTIANGTLNVQAGANVTSGTPTLQFSGMQLSAGSSGTATLNPTTANITITGNVTRPGIGANTLTLGGTSAGNIISGSITNGVSALAVIKTNSSTWTLSGNNAYTGPTTISQGILSITGSLTNSTVTNNGGTLTGTGIINGPVVIASGVLNPGVSTALGETLTIKNNLTLNGTALMQIGKSGSTPVNDSIVGVTNITYGGTLIVTNATGATINAGDSFVLFSASGTKTGNFASIVIAPPVAGLTNSFNPSSGTLTFSSLAPPTLNFTNNGGGSLQFSWTGNYKLQSQTNTLATGLNTNWVDYPGGGSSPVNVTVDPAKGSVFFRLSQ